MIDAKVGSNLARKRHPRDPWTLEPCRRQGTVRVRVLNITSKTELKHRQGKFTCAPAVSRYRPGLLENGRVMGMNQNIRVMPPCSMIKKEARKGFNLTPLF